MNSLRISLAAALAAACFVLPAAAQGDGQCIVAGRLSGQQWAPRLAGVQLLGADGQVVGAASRGALAAVRQVRLSQPALLSRCDGNAALFNADNEPAGSKTEVPACRPACSMSRAWRSRGCAAAASWWSCGCGRRRSGW